jgi:DNA invertase Pin-like site-specific DNA recombinase
MFDMKVGYARNSTESIGLKEQIERLLRFCCAEIIEEQSSAASSDRPVLIECLRAMTPGDTLVVWSLDQVGKSLKDLLDIVIALNDRSIGFCSLLEGIDTTNEAGRQSLQLMRVLARYERNRIRENTLHGLATARTNGRVGGRKPKLTEAQLCEIKALLKVPSASVDDIAKQFGVSRTTLYRNGCISSDK